VLHPLASVSPIPACRANCPPSTGTTCACATSCDRKRAGGPA
jgi:hypothetical protein